MTAPVQEGDIPAGKYRVDTVLGGGGMGVVVAAHPEPVAPGACRKFEAAAELSETAGVRLNLSDCYEKLGRTASAYGRADEALTLVERAGDAAATKLARKRLAALEPKLSYVTVTVPPAAAPGLSIRRDNEPVPQAAWGTAMPVDPGDVPEVGVGTAELSLGGRW